MDCLGAGEVEEDRAAQRHHAAIMRRFDRAIRERLDEPLYVPELCREIGASERTLLACCQEHLGMDPKHYLLLRRMHMVRRALRESTPAETTVTEVATQYAGSGNSAGSPLSTRRTLGKRHRRRLLGCRSAQPDRFAEIE
jgi:AraC-like DNA-binding protein